MALTPAVLGVLLGVVAWYRRQLTALSREAGLVEVRHDAQRRWYRLRTAPLHELDDWLSPYRQVWNDRLDALERHLTPGQNNHD